MDQIDSPAADSADAAVEAYLRRVDRGEMVDREQFLAAHDDVDAELRSFFAAEDLLGDLFQISALELAGCG